MKLWSINDVFSAPWRYTTEAVWKKYPNDEQPHVKSIDVLERRVTDDGRLLTTRLFGSHFSFPSLIVQMLGLPEMSYAIEYSEVDLKTQTMTMRTINSTFGSVLLVDEKLVYTRNPQNPAQTHLTQSAKIGISGIPFPSYFESMIVDNFGKNSAVGRGAVQKMVSTLGVENIIDCVTKELRILSQEVDTAANRIDDKLSEKLTELAKDLDRASCMVNDEIKHISHRLHSEMMQVLNGLEHELSHISVKVNLSQHARTFESSRSGLVEAVMKAGITTVQSSVQQSS